jgi:hypothetical protein
MMGPAARGSSPAASRYSPRASRRPASMNALSSGFHKVMCPQIDGIVRHMPLGILLASYSLVDRREVTVVLARHDDRARLDRPQRRIEIATGGTVSNISVVPGP